MNVSSNISFFISVFCLLFCVISLLYVKWYIKRRTSTSELLAEYRAEVYRLNAEINAVTDRDTLLVEDRIKKLKEILEDTDKRVKVYTQELDRSRTGEALYTSLGRGIRAALKTPTEISPEFPLVSPPAPEMSAQIPKLTLVRTERTHVAAAPVTPAPAPSVPKPPSKRQIRAQIEELVQEGIAPADIASRLGISIAEVNFAMNLMNSRKQ
jgi:hypothetical protein